MELYLMNQPWVIVTLNVSVLLVDEAIQPEMSLVTKHDLLLKCRISSNWSRAQSANARRFLWSLGFNYWVNCNLYGSKSPHRIRQVDVGEIPSSCERRGMDCFESVVDQTFVWSTMDLVVSLTEAKKWHNKCFGNIQQYMVHIVLHRKVINYGKINRPKYI